MDTRQRDCPAEECWKEMVPSAAVSRHPYGFLVVRLPAKISDADVRFNVWLRENRPGQEPNWPIHSHEVSMSSLVVRGELENVAWPEPKFGFGEPLYLASYTKTTSVLTKSDLRNLGRPQELRRRFVPAFNTRLRKDYFTPPTFRTMPNASRSACFMRRRMVSAPCSAPTVIRSELNFSALR